MNLRQSLISCLVLLIGVRTTVSVLWDDIRCSSDTDPQIPDGTTADLGRFPWLGIIQHSFYIGGTTRFAVTAGVLIHPAYAIAPAEDISRILPEQLSNNTKFVLWQSNEAKFALDVTDYILHPEYEDKQIFATLALLELASGFGDGSPVLPVCLPLSVGGTFSDLYAVKMTDENRELQKEVYKMSYVSERDCNEFYYENKLTYKKMTPLQSICAKSERFMPPCVWDGGTALITKQSWGFWKLIGFSVRGPGCGAPARFLVVNDYMSWINDMLSQLPDEQVEEVHRIGARRISPVEIILYGADKIIPKDQGNCDRRQRGGVMYKDSFEVTINKDFGQGFFYVVVSRLAEFKCAIINIEDATARSNAVVWLEHYCHREITGIAHGQTKPRDYRKEHCFLYFKSAAFVTFRFFFSFKITVEVTLFGTEDIPRKIPNPFVTDETTDSWWPTASIIHWDTFAPYYLWYWFL